MRNKNVNTPQNQQSCQNAVSDSCGSINENGLTKTNTVLDLSSLDKNQSDFIKEKTGLSLKDGSFPFLIFDELEYEKCTLEYFQKGSIWTDEKFTIVTYAEFFKIHFEN
jgi:hypothetical protein